MSGIQVGEKEYKYWVSYYQSPKDVYEDGKYRGDINGRSVVADNHCFGRKYADCYWEIIARLVAVEPGTILSEAMKAMQELSLRMADNFELLTFGNQFPDVQKEFRVIQFGQWSFAGSEDGCITYLDYTNGAGFYPEGRCTGATRESDFYDRNPVWGFHANDRILVVQEERKIDSISYMVVKG